jgi:hypothetical protein
MKKRLIDFWYKIKFTTQRLYRILLPPKKRQEKVWSDLIKLCRNSNWRVGIFESEHYVEIEFQIADGEVEKYLYFVGVSSLTCRARVAVDIDEERMTDVFILAQHFNNLLNYGDVVVNVSSRFVEYTFMRDILIPYLYSGDIYDQLLLHHNTSKDLYASFQRLSMEGVEPALIIADFLEEKRVKED